MKGRKISIPKFHPMKLTFLFIVLILGIWLATTTFGKMFEGATGSMEKPKKTNTSMEQPKKTMDEVMEKAKVAIEKAAASDAKKM